MSDIGAYQGATPAPQEAGFGDYVQLLKPRVMSLVVFTALVGLLVAPVALHPVEAFAAILFIALGAGASGALNMWWDADIDAVMMRTRSRPVPAGKVQPGEALGLGLGKIAQPLRVAITGTQVSPSIDHTVFLAGRDQALARIDAALAKITG